MMKILCNGLELSSSELTYSEVGFGKADGSQTIKFEMEVELQRFIKQLNPIYEECIEELVADDAATGHFEPPYPGAESYPTLKQFIDIGGEYWEEFIDTFLKFDILSLFFKEGNSSAGYRVVSLDSFELQSGNVILTGKVLKN